MGRVLLDRLFLVTILEDKRQGALVPAEKSQRSLVTCPTTPDTRLMRGGAGFAFGEQSRSRNPFLSSCASLPEQNVPFLLRSCSDWSFLSLPRRKRSTSKRKGKKKKHSNEKESDGERQLVMKLAGVGGKWGETTAALRLRQGLGSQP